MIHPARIRQLNDRPSKTGNCVLYWMQAGVRAIDNLALLYAI